MRVLRALATARPHLLVLEEPGGVAARLAIEGFARRAGWALVDSPADADVLVLAGPDAGLAPYAERVWEQLPGPRARVRVEDATFAAEALGEAQRQLRDVAVQRRDVRQTERPAAAAPPGGGGHDMSGHAGHDMSGDADDPPAEHDMGEHNMGGPDMSGHAEHDRGGQEMGGPDMRGHAGHDTSGDADDPHAEHDMGGHDMGGHDMGGHDMGGHDMGSMEMPAGLAMADRAADRDGLKLDVLTIPWGPALTWWPGGLVVTTVLQGDVIQQARVERVGDAAAGQAGWSAAVRGLPPASAAVVIRLDALLRLLGVAGWDGARLDTQRLRDDLLAGTALAARRPALRRLARRVGRSRTFARMSAGLTVGGASVVERYRGWLDDVAAAVDGQPLRDDPPLSDPETALVHALSGSELGNARLLVAALGLELSGARAAEVAGV